MFKLADLRYWLESVSHCVEIRARLRTPDSTAQDRHPASTIGACGIRLMHD
jgi:hypothetical protein